MVITVVDGLRAVDPRLPLEPDPCRILLDSVNHFIHHIPNNATSAGARKTRKSR
jgi:hypothetical protein